MCKMIFLNKTYTFCVIHHINCMNLRFRRWCYNLFPLNFEKKNEIYYCYPSFTALGHIVEFTFYGDFHFVGTLYLG